MDIPVTSITRPILSKLVALQSFFFARPRLDIDLTNNQESLYGQKSLGASHLQDYSGPIAIPDVKYDFEFYWNFDIRIRNNSSKTAYNIKIENIHKGANDYLSKLDGIASLKEGETINLDYRLKHFASMNGSQASEFSQKFPNHIEKIEILISYTNEGRKKFYTRFIATKDLKTNEHLLTKPKTK